MLFFTPTLNKRKTFCNVPWPTSCHQFPQSSNPSLELHFPHNFYNDEFEALWNKAIHRTYAFQQPCSLHPLIYQSKKRQVRNPFSSYALFIIFRNNHFPTYQGFVVIIMDYNTIITLPHYPCIILTPIGKHSMNGSSLITPHLLKECKTLPLQEFKLQSQRSLAPLGALISSSFFTQFLHSFFTQFIHLVSSHLIHYQSIQLILWINQSNYKIYSIKQLMPYLIPYKCPQILYHINRSFFTLFLCIVSSPSYFTVTINVESVNQKNHINQIKKPHKSYHN